MRDTTIETIRRILCEHPKKPHIDSDLYPAGVMLLVYPKDGQYCVLLNKRTDRVEHHKGEVSFPGGARDPEDQSLLETALRETHEEMGILPQDIQLLGELDDVPTRSRFVINTFVGTIPYPYSFAVSDDEIAEVLEVPLSVLMNPDNVRDEVRVVDEELVSAPSYAYDHHLIYGATARILKQFLNLLENAPDKGTLWKTAQS